MPKATFQTSRKRLLEAVRRVEPALYKAKFPSKPLLQCVKLSVNGAVTLTATNREVFVVEAVDAQHDGSADVLLSPNRLKQALSRSKDDQVQIEIEEDESLTIIGANARLTIPKGESPAKDFPKPAAVEQIVGYVKGSDLVRALKLTVPFCDEESTRYALGSVLFEIGQTLTLVATDTRRLTAVSIQYTPYKGRSKSRQVLVPARLLKAVMKAADAHPAVELRIDDKFVSFGLGNCVMTALQIEGRFPQWRDVIPTDENHRVEFRVGELREALQAVVPAMTEESHACEFAFNGTRIELKCGDAESGFATASCAVTDDQRPGRGVESILLDPEYVLEYLDSLPKDVQVASMTMVDKKTPVVFRAVDQGQHLIMPLSVDRPRPAEPAEEPVAEPVSVTQTVLSVRYAVTYFANLHGAPLDRSLWGPSHRSEAARLIRQMHSQPFGRGALQVQVARGQALLA